MSALAGILNISDTERAYVSVIGRELVFDAVKELFNRWNAEVALMQDAFVERVTENHQMRYLLPGGGKLQLMGRQAPAGAMKRTGKYDVAFPLRQYGAQFVGDEIDLAYFTIAELDAHLTTIMDQDRSALRIRILTSLFEDTNLTWLDPLWGNLTIRRLANTDGTLYPPVLGSEVEADDDHYLNSGYTVAAIAAANNPVPTLRDEISEHFGGVGSTGRNFVYFHGTDQTAYLTAIAGYTATTDMFLRPGDNTAEVMNWPNVPGTIHGRGWGAWLCQWDGYIPDTFGMMILLDVPGPLYKRVDPSYTGIPRGLYIASKDEKFPFIGSHYQTRYGLGCANRLCVAIMNIDETGAYTPPAAYTE